MKIDRLLVLALRVGLGALFVAAGILKLRDASAFATDIANYQIFTALAAPLAAILPWAEIVAGAVLIAHPALRWRQAAALCIAGMMLVFTAAAASALGRGLDVSCGCFGSDSSPLTTWTILRDLALLGAAVALVVFPAGREVRPAVSGTAA